MLSAMCNCAGCNVLYYYNLRHDTRQALSEQVSYTKNNVSRTKKAVAKVDVKLHIGKTVVISWLITCCVLQVMSPASN